MTTKPIVVGMAIAMFAGWTAGVTGQGTASGAAQTPEKPATEASQDLSPVEQQPEVAKRIVESTNRYRESEELPEVRPNPELARAAREFAEFMAGTGKYGHTADEKEPRERAAEHGYKACIVAENIGLQFGTRPLSSEALAGSFVEGWKNSKVHRANLLDPDVMETGVAVAKSEQSGRFYAVQLFGRPKSASIRAEIENRAGVLVKYKIGEENFELEDRVVRIHELCRPTEFTFLLPATDGTDRTIVERVARKTKLVVQRDDSRELTVVRSAGVER